MIGLGWRGWNVRLEADGQKTLGEGHADGKASEHGVARERQLLSNAHPSKR
jgi:hypothetical protein